MKPLSRRSVATGLAAAVTAIPAVGLSVGLAKASRGPSELAALIRRYWSEVDAFNANAPEDDDDYIADQRYDLTMAEMVGVQARSADDAIAAMDWII